MATLTREEAEKVIDACEILRRVCHANSVEHGFLDQGRSFGDEIALLHSELSEALECYREGAGYDETTYENGVKPIGIPSELADVLVRVFDTCGARGIQSIGHVLVDKMTYNHSRPHRHGGKRV